MAAAADEIEDALLQVQLKVCVPNNPISPLRLEYLDSRVACWRPVVLPEVLCAEDMGCKAGPRVCGANGLNRLRVELVEEGIALGLWFF